ncbi:MAG: GYD domain-containing protein [Alphaproteobacteria bacterium]|nr:GYD domain-containing protein [Alphaproteobacteria bacterium]
MAHYLLSFSFSAAAAKSLVDKPQDRRAAAAKAIKAIGGKLKDYYFALGADDAIVVVELPDNVAAAACGMLTGSSGAFSHVRSTPLLTMAEAVRAMRTAKRATKAYRPPGR